MNQDRKNYHLICGTVMFQAKIEDKIHDGMMTLNAVMSLNDPGITEAGLALAQEVVQRAFRNNMEGQEVSITNLILNNIIYMGYFTSEEFHNIPRPNETPKVAG